jgi:hypothetical protein
MYTVRQSASQKVPSPVKIRCQKMCQSNAASTVEDNVPAYPFSSKLVIFHFLRMRVIVPSAYMPLIAF